jgi:hypothetical protein
VYARNSQAVHNLDRISQILSRLIILALALLNTDRRLATKSRQRMVFLFVLSVTCSSLGRSTREFRMAVPAPGDPSSKDVRSMHSAPISPPDLPKLARQATRHMSTWICLGCGYHHLDDSPPSRCPRCTGEKFLFTCDNDSGN